MDRSTPNDHEIYIVLGGGNGLRQRIEQAGFDVLHALADGSVFIVEGAKANRDKLQSIGTVTDAVPNETYTVDDIEQRGVEPANDEPRSDDQWDKRLVQAPAAHERATGKGTTVAVVDSGVSFTHPELASRVDTDRSRLIRNGHVHSGTGEVRTATGPGKYFKPIEKSTQHVADDVEGHGTHVAGIAAASRNDTGILGMAPDATIVSLRALQFVPYNSFGGTTYAYLSGTIADILVAIDYAVEIGVDVVNLSVGDIVPNDSRAFTAVRRVVQHAIEQGVVVVVAAGNSGFDLDRKQDYVLPADAPGPITVSATGPTDKRSSYANYGNGTVDVSAPGGSYEKPVLSTVPESIYDRQYDYQPGTSMAAPQVAGLACLLRELAPDLHPRRVRQAITESAVELSGEDTSGLGTGRIDAPSAIDRISNRI